MTGPFRPGDYATRWQHGAPTRWYRVFLRDGRHHFREVVPVPTAEDRDNTALLARDSLVRPLTESMWQIMEPL